MLVWISKFVIGILSDLLYCYFFSKLIHEKFRVKPIMLVTILLCEMISSYAGYTELIIKPLIVNINYVIILYFSYRKSLPQVIISVLGIGILFAICELFWGNFLIRCLSLSTEFLYSEAIGIILINILITATTIILFCIKPIKLFLRYLLNWINNNEFMKNSFLSIAIVITLGILLKYNISELDSLPNIIIINLFIICTVILTISFFKENSDKNKMKYEYEQLCEYSRMYENLLTDKSKSLHEYRNQLISIKGMISEDKKKAINYINELLNIQDEIVNTEWLHKMKNLPNGGVKGLIYHKMIELQNNNINTYLDISDELKDHPIWNMNEKDLRQFIYILGIYIDNALDAALRSSKKYIIIEACLDKNNIVMTFSNTYSGSININKIDEIGFSTKGQFRGYGLSIVKDIMNENHKFKQEREINGIYYVQKLVISK